VPVRRNRATTSPSAPTALHATFITSFTLVIVVAVASGCALSELIGGHSIGP
jgi:hypothetical protein